MAIVFVEDYAGIRANQSLSSESTLIGLDA